MRARLGATLAACALASAALAADGARAESKARIRDIEQDINDWDIPAAEKELSELEKIVPGDLEPLQYFRGRVAFEEGKYEDAVKLLKAAGVEDKPGSYLRLAVDTQKIVAHHEKAESAHFIFFFPPGKDQVLAPWALETLEAQRAALEKDLGYAPTGKVRVEVVQNARELAHTSTLTLDEINTTGTIAICKFNKLIVTSPKAVPRGYDWQDTLAHEYTHLVVTQKSHNTVPIWLHEGIAKYFETRWRGAPGLALTPSNLALLGDRVRRDNLVPFEKMHPSIALLPSAEDAATAFAEVFFAVDYLYREKGASTVRAVIQALGKGESDKRAVELATGMTFPGFERAWLAHIRKQPFPKALIPHDYRSPQELAKRVKEGAKQEAKREKKEISFGDFAEVEEPEARKLAHLGELFRERNRPAAAAEELGRARALVGDKYESISNKLALALLEQHASKEAEAILLSSLKMHPGVPATSVHLGRIYLAEKDLPKARAAYLDALAADPFDEEIHVSLSTIFDGLKEPELAARARHATSVLTGLSEDGVKALSRQLAAGSRAAKTVAATRTERVRVEPKGPSRGPNDAPVTLVEFADFECPFCKREKDTLDRVLLAYPGKVRWVFRQFPLDQHPHAIGAANAALCAHEQGRFWEYHDALFQNQRRLETEDLRSYAQAVGLDAHRFAACLESGRTQAQVRDDLGAGQAANVTGTPALFINGTRISSSLPLEELKRIIDEQLGAN